MEIFALYARLRSWKFLLALSPGSGAPRIVVTRCGANFPASNLFLSLQRASFHAVFRLNLNISWILHGERTFSKLMKEIVYFFPSVHGRLGSREHSRVIPDRAGTNIYPQMCGSHGEIVIFALSRTLRVKRAAFRYLGNDLVRFTDAQGLMFSLLLFILYNCWIMGFRQLWFW